MHRTELTTEIKFIPTADLRTFLANQLLQQLKQAENTRYVLYSQEKGDAEIIWLFVEVVRFMSGDAVMRELRKMLDTSKLYSLSTSFEKLNYLAINLHEVNDLNYFLSALETGIAAHNASVRSTTGM
jgi:hypothetical protein